MHNSFMEQVPGMCLLLQQHHQALAVASDHILTCIAAASDHALDAALANTSDNGQHWFRILALANNNNTDRDRALVAFTKLCAAASRRAAADPGLPAPDIGHLTRCAHVLTVKDTLAVWRLAAAAETAHGHFPLDGDAMWAMLTDTCLVHVHTAAHAAELVHALANMPWPPIHDHHVHTSTMVLFCLEDLCGKACREPAVDSTVLGDIATCMLCVHNVYDARIDHVACTVLFTAQSTEPSTASLLWHQTVPLLQTVPFAMAARGIVDLFPEDDLLHTVLLQRALRPHATEYNYRTLIDTLTPCLRHVLRRGHRPSTCAVVHVMRHASTSLDAPLLPLCEELVPVLTFRRDVMGSLLGPVMDILCNVYLATEDKRSTDAHLVTWGPRLVGPDFWNDNADPNTLVFADAAALGLAWAGAARALGSVHLDSCEAAARAACEWLFRFHAIHGGRLHAVMPPLLGLVLVFPRMRAHVRAIVSANLLGRPPVDAPDFWERVKNIMDAHPHDDFVMGALRKQLFGEGAPWAAQHSLPDEERRCLHSVVLHLAALTPQDLMEDLVPCMKHDPDMVRALLELQRARDRQWSSVRSGWLSAIVRTWPPWHALLRRAAPRPCGPQ